MDPARAAAWKADVPASAKLLMLALAEGDDVPDAARRAGVRHVHALALVQMLQTLDLVTEDARVIVHEKPVRPILTPPPPYRKAYIPAALRAAVYERDGYACVFCGRGREDGVVLSIDHVNPEWKGGETTEENCQTACTSCNSSKGTSEMPRRMMRDRTAEVRVERA